MTPRSLVDPAWLAARLEGDTPARLHIVHVSTTRRAFNRRHIPGAVFSDIHRELAGRGRAPETADVEREWLLPDRAAAAGLLRRWGVEGRDEIVFYDDIGLNRHAIRGYWLLSLYRFPADRLHVLDGGLRAWVAAGGAVTAAGVDAARGAEAGDPGRVAGTGSDGASPDLDSRDDSLLATAEQVLAWSGEASTPGGPTRIVDVRTADEYVGRDVRALRGGHIPGARQRLFSDLLTPEGTVRPAGEILELLRGSGIEPSEVRAVYCQGGVRAALAWFALREVAGLCEVRNYAGSWEEWGNRLELPIEVPAGS